MFENKYRKSGIPNQLNHFKCFIGNETKLVKCEKLAEFFSRQFFLHIKSKSETLIGCRFCLKNLELLGLVGQEKPPVDDSRAHDGHLANSRSSKFLKQKVTTEATTDAIFRIQFYCVEKKFHRFYTGSGSRLCNIHWRCA